MPPNSLPIQPIIIDNNHSAKVPNLSHQNIDVHNQNISISSNPALQKDQNYIQQKSINSQEKESHDRNLEDQKNLENSANIFGYKKANSDKNVNNMLSGFFPQPSNPQKYNQIVDQVIPSKMNPIKVDQVMSFGPNNFQLNNANISEEANRENIPSLISSEIKSETIIEKNSNIKYINPNMIIPNDDPESAIFLPAQNTYQKKNVNVKNILNPQNQVMIPKPQSDKKLSILNEPYFQKIIEGTEIQDSILLKNSQEFQILDKSESSTGKSKQSPNINKDTNNPDKAVLISPLNNDDLLVPVFNAKNSPIDIQVNKIPFDPKLSNLTENSSEPLYNKLVKDNQAVSENLKNL